MVKIADVRKKAKEVGLKTFDMKKADLIRAIQVAEGNFPCFGTAREYCDQVNCLWRKDCLPPQLGGDSKYSLKRVVRRGKVA